MRAIRSAAIRTLAAPGRLDFRAVALVAAGVLAAAACGASRGAGPPPPPRRSFRVPPRDEAILDPLLKAFRDRLVKAVERRDRSFVAAALGAGPGDADALESLSRRWRADDPSVDVWAELGAVLDLGGTFVDSGRDREFVAPYTSTARLPRGVDPADVLIVTARRIALRSSPRRGGRVVDWLSHELVRGWRDRDSRPRIEGEWIRVVTLGGKEGFLPMGHLRSPVGCRIHFVRVGGRWIIRPIRAGGQRPGGRDAPGRPGRG
jgi:hypothetical protein